MNYKWIAFSAIALALFVQVMSAGAIIISLKDIAQYFNISISLVSWLVIIQLLTVTAVLIPAGKISDRVGKKKFHIVGIIILPSFLHVYILAYDWMYFILQCLPVHTL